MVTVPGMTSSRLVRRLTPPLLADRPFRRYWTGQTISLFGDQISLIALPLTGVLVMHAGPARMGYLMASWLVPSLLFSLPAGSAIDRYGRPPVVLDFADAHFGNPMLDGGRAADFLPEGKSPIARQAWIDAWKSAVPGCDPARALALGEILAPLCYAVRYQEFLDGIEPSEHIYHRGDPITVIRAALRKIVWKQRRNRTALAF